MPRPDPSLPRYHQRRAIPSELAGKTQLLSEGYRLKPDAQPVAYFSSMQGSYPLFRRSDANPVKRRPRGGAV